MRRACLFLLLLCIAGGMPGFEGSAAFQNRQETGTDPDAWEARWNNLQPPDAVLDTIGVDPGMAVGEIGAGRGRYAVHVAKRVGPDGLVYANDIDREKLDYLRHRCERDSIGNIKTILGMVTLPHFPAAALDLIYIINIRC
ncbi:MAG: methyltransferase domain-containing protein, partial [Candidatus Latescibacterota bacterium]